MWSVEREAKSDRVRRDSRALGAMARSVVGRLWTGRPVLRSFVSQKARAFGADRRCWLSPRQRLIPFTQQQFSLHPTCSATQPSNPVSQLVRSRSSSFPPPSAAAAAAAAAVAVAAVPWSFLPLFFLLNSTERGSRDRTHRAMASVAAAATQKGQDKIGKRER